MDYANENEDFAFEEDDSIEKSVYEQYSSEENLDIKDSNGVFSNDKYIVEATVVQE